MDSKIIHQLLEKYWEGETSLQEEASLRAFFNQEEVPKEFANVQPLFQFFKKEQEAYLDSDFEKRLSTKLKVVDNQKPRAHSLTYYIKRVAAVAAIFIAILFFLNKNNFLDAGGELASVEVTSAEKAEAKMAYAEAKAALLLISKKLNKGTDKAESGIIQVQKATKIIKE